MNNREQKRVDLEAEIEKLFGHMDTEQKKKLICLWEKLDPIDRIYYQYCQDGQDRYQYYVERYMANKKFQDRIEEIFEPDVYDIDAGSTLEMWRLLDYEAEDSEHSLGRLKQRMQNRQKNVILNRLGKYARDGVQIREKNVEEYLELLSEQKKRQKLILKAEEQVPAELLIYFDEHRDDLNEMEERCLVLKYCMSRLEHFGFEKEVETSWKQIMCCAVTEFSETVLEEIRTRMQEIE